MHIDAADYLDLSRCPITEPGAGRDALIARLRAELDGDARLIRTLRLQPGDLQIFKGRHALQRVTPLAGLQPR